MEKEIDTLKDEIGIIRKNLKELEKRQGLVDILVKRNNLIRDTQKALLEIQNGFIVEIKEKISQEATRLFIRDFRGEIN